MPPRDTQKQKHCGVWFLISSLRRIPIKTTGQVTCFIIFLIFNKVCLPSCQLNVLEGVFFTTLKGTHFLIPAVSFTFTGYHKQFFTDSKIVEVQVLSHPYIFALLQNTPLVHSVHFLPFLWERYLLRKCLIHSSFPLNPAFLSSCLVQVT